MRIQLNRGGPDTFDEACRTSDLLYELGVGLFSSPVMAGVSKHGYECRNPNSPHANQHHGEFIDLLAHLAERRMTFVVDVPYHASTCPESFAHADLTQRRRFCYTDKHDRTLGFMDFGNFAKLRMEDPTVSREYHLLLRLLIKMGLLHGLRLDAVDHIPGVVNLLHDLKEYGVPIIAECDLPRKDRTANSRLSRGRRAVRREKTSGATLLEPSLADADKSASNNFSEC